MEGIARTPEELFAHAQTFGHSLSPPAVVFLRGELGAGKTLWAKGIVAARGGDPHKVVSPTYTLLHIYSLSAEEILHLDLYRLSSPQDLLSLDLEPPEPHQIWLVEWPERGEPFLPPPTYTVEIAIPSQDPGTRKFRVLTHPVGRVR